MGGEAEMNVIERLKTARALHRRIHFCSICDNFLKELIKELEVTTAA
jgi:hypothetical protein